MTSVAAYDYRGQTVVFAGTRSGKIKKVGKLSVMPVGRDDCSPRRPFVGTCRAVPPSYHDLM